MKGRRKFRPLNVPTSTPTFDQIGRKFERRGFQTIGGSAGEESDAFVRYERQGWVTDYNLVATGTEAYDWTLNSTAAGWTITVDDPRVWTAGETALLKGVRWEANVPEVDGDNFAGAKLNHALYLNNELTPYHSVTEPNLGAALFPTCISRHMVQQKITAIQFPIWLFSSPTMASRLRYYRILHSGVPVTGILDACDEDDWTNRYTQVASRVSQQLYEGAIWQLPQPSSYRFRRGVRLGLDAWIEIKANTTGNHAVVYLEAASTHTSFTAPAAKWSHGVFGVTTGTNAGFLPGSQTYSLAMTGGTWRPYQTSPSDDFTWLTASGHTITGAKCETLAENASRDYLILDWAREIPMLKIILGGGRTADSVSMFYYVPEDVSDYVNRWNVTSTGPTTTYIYAQSPGGTWNHKGATTFVPYFWMQSDTVDSFTDQTVTARPTSITVTRSQQ